MTYYSALHYAAKAEKSASEAALHNLKNKLTNCITEIPQDIKLELNNGTLTLKAGSKVYVPNGKNADGSLKFDVVVIGSDRAIQNTSPTVGQRFVWVTLPSGYGNGVVQYCFSGTTSTMNSTKADTFSTFYNTETNKIYRGNGTTWEERPYSLPICLATNDATAKFTSIDQVFNGFGYIGSTVFALPGVKGLAPNGRNTDGTLRNKEVILNSVKIGTTTGASNLFMLNQSGGIEMTADAFHITSSLPTAGSRYERCFDTSENQMYLHTAGSTNWAKVYYVIAGNMSKVNNGTITSFTPKLPFRAADDQEVVKTSGDQTIGGSKIFTSSVKVKGSQGKSRVELYSNAKINEAPSAEESGNIFLIGSDGIASALCGLYKQPDGDHLAQFAVRNHANTAWSVLGVYYTKDDVAKTVAPTPAATSNTTEIATTAWVRSKAAGFPNYSAAVSIADSTTSYTPPSNGIIQMGYLSAGDNSYSGGVTHSSGVDMVSQYSAYKYSNGGTFWCIVEKGVTYTLTSSQPNKKFIPFK